MLSFTIGAGENRIITVAFETTPVYVDRPHALKAVRCGSLVFSLPIDTEWRKLEYVRDGVDRTFPYCDYELLPKSDWNYGFCGDTLSVMRRAVSDVPFSSKQPAVTIKANVRKIVWGLEDGFETVCAKVPASREPIGDTETVELYPYGCAKLRMTELPIVE